MSLPADDARSLHADAVGTLTAWTAPDGEQESLRRLFLDHVSAHDDALLRECQPDHVTASALVVTADGARVLLVRHRKAGLWLQTGGHCEPTDLRLVEAAAREAREETGLADLRVDPVPLRLSRHPVPFCGPVQPAHHLDVQFLAVAAVSAEPTVAPGEDPVRWFSAADEVEPTDADTMLLITAARERLRQHPRT